MSVLKKFLGILVLFGLSLVGIVAFKVLNMPSEIEIKESKIFQTKPSSLIALLNNFENWNKWSTWNTNSKVDVWKNVSSNKESAAFWNGEKVGSGKAIWLSQSEVPISFKYQLQYLQKNKSENQDENLREKSNGKTLQGEFLLQGFANSGSSEAVELVWIVKTELKLEDKLFWVVANIENAFRAEMQAGLNNMEKVLK